jgi:hypothetical protein
MTKSSTKNPTARNHPALRANMAPRVESVGGSDVCDTSMYFEPGDPIDLVWLLETVSCVQPSMGC